MVENIEEKAVAVLWPSIGRFPLGRMLGRAISLQFGFGIVTLGNVLALMLIPVAVVLYFWKFMPRVCRRYRLTTHRIVIQRGLMPVDAEHVGLDQFDEIRVEYLPGQRQLRCGDLLFLRAGQAVFRLPAVPCPETARQMILKVRQSVLAIDKLLAQQAAAS